MAEGTRAAETPGTQDDGAAHVVVVGAGVAGLGAALALSRSGHRVTIVERDATPLPEDPDAAFLWNRRGAPQVRHSHALLARLRNLLRDRYPDVLEQLLAAGATEMRFTEMMPEGIDDPSPLPGDDDLVALACRRTTFEWVLRRAVLADPRVELLDGAVADGLVLAASSGPPVVCGVRLQRDPAATDDDAPAAEVRGDLVVAAGGRRSALPRWLAEIDVDVAVEEEDTGIVYLSRFYRLHDGVEPPRQEGPIGGDLGYLKYAVFQGDRRTFSVTFAVRSGDDELRSLLLDPDVFDAAARTLPATGPWVEPAVADAVTEVYVMAGLLNRHISFTDADGAPLVLGLHAVGDAHTCTNPLYGRGCSLGMVQANLLADQLTAHPGVTPADAAARGTGYEADSEREIAPWYHAAVQQDRMARDVAERERARRAGDDPSAAEPDPSSSDEQGSASADGSTDPQQFFRDLLLEGLLPAARLHASVLRAFLRMFNLLDPPEALMADPQLLALVLAVYQARDERPPEPPLGPNRRTMLAAIRPAA